MRVMELDEPLDKETIKARYRVLVKRYHPDANKNDKAAEEKFKQVSDAYRTLMKSLETEEAAA